MSSSRAKGLMSLVDIWLVMRSAAVVSACINDVLTCAHYPAIGEASELTFIDTRITFK